MREKIQNLRERIVAFWTSLSRNRKIIIIASSLIVFLLIISLIWLTTKKNYVPLYQNLSQQEASQIKEELDEGNVDYELKDAGTTIMVPESEAEDLLVDLAGKGLPNSGSIDYSFFSENSSFGITDNEFDVMKLDATQTELSNLIKRIEGIEDAKVMINLPREPLFVNEDLEEASASIVIHTEPGYQFENNEINSLYHLVSKAVPNLTEENIVIMNQHFEYFDKDTTIADQRISDYNSQQTIKKDIEKDIQRRLQQMIGAMVGHDKAIVSVTADIDFTQEKREEELIEPVDVENMEGLPVSIETIHETYSGDNVEGGVVGTGEEDIPGYEAIEGDGNGEYELIKERINNDFNHIRKDIVESPYRIRDLGIQVAIDEAKERDGEEIQLLDQQERTQVEEGITSILNSMIRTSIHTDFAEDEDEIELETEEKISIVFQEFSSPSLIDVDSPNIPTWIYVVGAILVLAIIILGVILVRSRRSEETVGEEIIIDEYTDDEEEIADITTEKTESQKKVDQIEKMAKEKPEEFAKLLRSWMAED